MQKRIRWFQTIWLLAGFCLALTFTLLLSPLNALAHQVTTSATGPTFSVNVGFNSRYRDGNWVPVQITFSNNGSEFHGTVSINVPAAGIGNASGNTPLSSIYQQPISLPPGAQKQVTLDVPFKFGTQGFTQNITVDLLDSNGQKVSGQTTLLHGLGSNDVFVGLLSDQSTGFGALSTVPLPSQGASLFQEQLNTTTFPDSAEVLKNFDLLVLDNFTTGALSKEQLAALQGWVNQGGSLLVIGGPEWRRTLSSLPASLQPVTATGTTMLPAGTRLLPISGPANSDAGQQKVSDTLQASVTASTAQAKAGGTVLLAAGSTPLIVQSSVGQGTVYYLAYDPTLEPVAGWPGATALWKSLLYRTLGNQLLTSNQSQGVPAFWPGFRESNMSGLLQSLFPSTFPSIWLLLALLLSYVAILGPVRLLLIRRLKKRDWSWRIILSTIVLFSLLSYGLALQQKGTSTISSSVSVIQLNQPGPAGSIAHITTYIGVFVPNEGDYQIHIPGNSLIEPSDDSFQQPSAGKPVVIQSQLNGTDIKLQGANTWTLHSLISQHNHQVTGGIVSHLTLQQGTLVGSVTNTLPYALNDAYVLVYNQYSSLGSLAAGQTKQVNLTINNGQNLSLADQIASKEGVHLSYDSSFRTQTMSDAQRRVMMLATLSGENGYNCMNCPLPAYGSSGGVYIQNQNMAIAGPMMGPNSANTADPLLLPNAAVTLIGWADQQAETTGPITINGSAATGIQEALVQAPLDLNVSDTVNLPQNIVTGRVVDIQSQANNIQTVWPNAYSMSTGNMTFEFMIPGSTHPGNNTLTVSEPKNVQQQISGPAASGPVANANQLHAYLYNWQTGSWDSFTFNQYAFSTRDVQSYTNADGRVLLQLANQETSLGTIVFGKPSLQLQDNNS